MTTSSYALFALAATLLYVVLNQIKTYLDNRAFIKTHGCQKPFALPQTERIIGYHAYKNQKVNSKARRILFSALERYREFNVNSFQVTVLGRTFISTIEPENVKAILATNFKDFGLGQREEAFGPLLGKGIFTSDGAHWEHSRALVRPNFAKSQVADLETFESHIRHMIAKIPRDGSTVDMQKLFFQLTFDSATEFLFGESVDILRSPEGSEQQLFATSFDRAQGELNKRTRLGPFMAFYRNKTFKSDCDRVHAFVDRFVFKALEYRKMADAEKRIEDTGKKQQYVFLQELAKSTDDPKQLRDELLNILVAGRDTTAGLLSNAFHVLARRPDVWQKLQAEVTELNGEFPDYETLRNMKYLRNFLNETLRLYPSVPGNARFAVRNTTIPLGGGPDGLSPIFIPKGSIVAYNAFCMQRRKDIYGPDADEFKPERWDPAITKSYNANKVGWAYLPFNGGPRICVGQQFALTEASYTIVRLCQEFVGVECRDLDAEGKPKPWVENLQLTLSSGDGTLVNMVPRQ